MTNHHPERNGHEALHRLTSALSFGGIVLAQDEARGLS